MKAATAIFAIFTLLITAGHADFTIEKHVAVHSRSLSPERKQVMERQRESENRQLYRAQEGFVDLGLARQSQIDTNEEHHSQIGEGDEEGRFGKVVANPNSQKLTERGIEIDEEEVRSIEFIASSSARRSIALVSDSSDTTINHSLYMYHWIDRFPKENILKIEDGSEWTFDKEDVPTVENWRSGDKIIVSSRFLFPWSTNYTYAITNKDRGKTITANPLSALPTFGPNSTWVAAVDYNAGQVYLYNGHDERTVWEVSNTDLELLKEWQNNDIIIVGENNHFLWWFSPYNHILINANVNHHNVRARQVSGSGIRN